MRERDELRMPPVLDDFCFDEEPVRDMALRRRPPVDDIDTRLPGVRLRARSSSAFCGTNEFILNVVVE